MLPAFLNTARSSAARKFVTLGTAAALVTAMATPPAMAWGDKEQNFVAGVATAVALAAILKPQIFYKTPAPKVPTPAPVYYTPAPTYSSSIYSTPSATAFNAYEPNQRRQIQSALAARGYYTSSIDGAFGPSTYNAVVAYANGLGKSSILSTTSGAFTLYDGLIY